MSHKSGHIIINALIEEGEHARALLPCLTSEQCDRLANIRERDEYNAIDRLYLGMLVASIADDPAE